MVSQDSGQAADWYKKAAKQDDRLADWLLGRLYYNENGVPRDLNAAESWLQKAANQGDPFGQQLLGLIRLERNDYPKAADWFRKAAMQGLPQAQAQLAQLLKDGRGVTQDQFEAYLWLLVSFDAGNQAVAADLAALEGALGSNRVEEAKEKLATSSRPSAGLWSRADAPAGRASSTWSRPRLHRTSNDFAASQGLCGADTLVRPAQQSYGFSADSL